MEPSLSTMDRAAFLALAFERPAELLRAIRDEERAIVVKGFVPLPAIAAFRAELRDFRRSVAASWHPYLDGCPDYHRINDEYEKSYVKGRLRVYYFHRWNARARLFDPFKPVFEIKNALSGEPREAHYDSLPSSGAVSRIAVNHFPRGGGYLSEHVDPTSPFALLQTIIQASTPGKDYAEGGLFYRRKGDRAAIELDSATEPGDLLLLSPGVAHGVRPIDPGAPIDWERDDGRLTIVPIVMYSDYVSDPAKRSRPVG